MPENQDHLFRQHTPSCLTAITCLKELQELRDLYLQSWPKHCVGYYTLDNFLRWLKNDPKLDNLHIYTLNNDWRLDGLFVVVDRYQLFVNSLKCGSDNDRMGLALSLLNWSTGYKVSSFLERHRSAVVGVVDRFKLLREYDSLTVLYYMPAVQAAKLRIPCLPGYVVRALTLEDAGTVDGHWPNRHQGSHFLLQRLITWNINVGVYEESSGDLVAWCLRLQGGFLGALQVKDSHKRLGLGSLVTCAIAQRLASELGHDVMALVNKDNVASCGMFEKLNFSISDNAYWLRTLPTVDGHTWPNGI